jgi:hypothetical protein
MSRSTPRAARLGRRAARGSRDTVDECRELTRESGKFGIDEFTARDDNEIAAGLGFVLTEEFAGAAFGSIPDDGAPHLSGCGHTQPGVPCLVRHRKERHEPSADLHA